jgi:hypothetical protein
MLKKKMGFILRMLIIITLRDYYAVTLTRTAQSIQSSTPSVATRYMKVTEYHSAEWQQITHRQEQSKALSDM